MVRRPGRRAADPDAPVVDLDRVLADDARIDAIAGRSPPTGDPPGPAGSAGSPPKRHECPSGELLFDLFDEWRAELTRRPLPPSPILTLPAPVAAPARRSRSLRPVLAVAAAIGAVVVGTATIGAADAVPGSAFWPITQVIWPDRAASVESSRAVRSALAEARTALDAGRTSEAKAAISRAADALRGVPDGAEHDEMRHAVIELLVDATPPPGRAPVPAPPNPTGGGRSTTGTAPSTVGSPDPAELRELAAGVATTPIEPNAAGDQPMAAPPPGVAAPAALAPASPAEPAPSAATGSSAGPAPSAAAASSDDPAPSADPPPSSADSPEPTSAAPEPTSAAVAPTPPPPDQTTQPAPTAGPAETSGSTQAGATEQSAPSPTPTSSEPDPAGSEPADSADTTGDGNADSASTAAGAQE